MGRLFLQYLNEKEVYCCSTCDSHLSVAKDLISKAFHGRYGRALLFNSTVNIYKGIPAMRPLTTGMHVVCDIYCINCQEYVGWYYEYAEEESQKYKIGKFIIEKHRTYRYIEQQQQPQNTNAITNRLPEELAMTV